jgi:hypothetical protein
MTPSASQSVADPELSGARESDVMMQRSDFRQYQRSDTDVVAITPFPWKWPIGASVCGVIGTSRHLPLEALIVVRSAGQRNCLWGAIDHEGEVLDTWRSEYWGRVMKVAGLRAGLAGHQQSERQRNHQ